MCKLPSSWPPAWGTQGRFCLACCVSAGSAGLEKIRWIRWIRWIREENSVRLSNSVFYNDFCTFCRKMITFFGGWPLGRPLGAKMAPHAIWTACGAPFGGLLEPCWRQDGPSGAKMSQVGIKLAVKFGKLRTKRRILYIYKLPIHRIHAAG